MNYKTITYTYYDDDGEEREVEVPARWEICGRCRGEGKHSNPAIDGHGISAEEWQNEWCEEEREMYMNGVYDIRCEECGGSGKIQVPDYDSVNPKIMKQLEAQWEAEAELAAMEAAERRMGC